jgi:hypothetical protein
MGMKREQDGGRAGPWSGVRRERRQNDVRERNGRPRAIQKTGQYFENEVVALKFGA